MAISKDDIIKAIEEMKITELNDLVKAIETHFGVVATAAVTQNNNADGDQNEKTNEVNAVLTEIGGSKVAVIQLVKKLTGKSLMESKKMLDKLPVIIKEKIKTEEGEELKGEFSAIGAIIDLK